MIILMFRRLLRPIVRRPLQPLLATGILAMGLAVVTAVLTYLRAFDQAFPGVEAGGLVRVFDEREGRPWGELSYLDYLDLRATSTTLDLAAVQRYYAASVRHEESAEVAFLEAVSGEYFGVLGARAHRGRLLGPDDDRPGSDPAVVVSWSWWQSAFGGREDILGHTLVLNFRPFTVVGVATPEFRGSDADARPQLWMPLAQFRTRYTGWDALAEDREVPLVTVLGRLDGVSIHRAQDELSRLGANLDGSHPRDEARHLSVRTATWIDPAAREAEAETLRTMTLAATGFLLLVVANVANVFLSIASQGARATAVRAALGAGPGRIVAEVLGRNLLLSGVAAAVGLGLAVPLSRRLGAYFARPSVWGEFVPRDFSVDGSVLSWGLGMALAMGIAATLPALRSSLAHPSRRTLAPEAAPGPGPSGPPTLRYTVQDGMIAVQSALAVALLVLSSLVLRTFATGQEVELGYETEDLLGGLVSVSSLGIERTDTRAFFDGLRAELLQEPWVEAVSQSDRLPLSGHPTVQVTSPEVDTPVPAIAETILHDYMETLGVPVVEGRDFEAADEGSDRGVLLNRSAAGRLFPAGAAVGGEIRLPEAGGGTRSLEVLGVVDDVRLASVLDEPGAAVFVPFRDSLWGTTNALLLRTSGPADREVATHLRRWLRARFPHLTVINSIPYRDVRDGALYTQRMNAELFTGLAALGLVLACVGISSVVSLGVVRRRREIGIRRAVGATERQIRSRMVRRAMIPVSVGAAVGLALSFGASHLVESLLYGVSPFDPASVAAGLGLLLAAAALAAWVPTWATGRISIRDVVA